MVDLTIVVDLDEQQSLKEFESRLDLFDECLAQSRHRRPPPRCPHCASWVPFGAIVCWQCRQIIGMVRS
jgi:hypothetical protein